MPGNIFDEGMRLLDADWFPLLRFALTSECGSYPERWRVIGPLKPGNRRRVDNARGYGANSCPSGARYEGCRNEPPSH